MYITFVLIKVERSFNHISTVSYCLHPLVIHMGQGSNINTDLGHINRDYK